MFANKSTRWSSARNKCKELNGRFDLVSILSNNENDFVTTAIKTLGLKREWIGLTDRAQNGHFTWSDGSLFKYGNDYKKDVWWFEPDLPVSIDELY